MNFDPRGRRRHPPDGRHRPREAARHSGPRRRGPAGHERTAAPGAQRPTEGELMQPVAAGRAGGRLPASTRRGTDVAPRPENEPRWEDGPRPESTPGRRNRPRRRNERSAGPAALVAVLVIIGLALTAGLAGPPATAAGDAARGFSLPALMNADQRISLSDYAGQPLILNFCASWSPSCAAQTRLLALFYRLRPGLVMVGIDSRDSRAAALRMLRASRVGYPVADDPAESVGGRYGVPGVPTTYFLNARHQIIWRTVGYVHWARLKLELKAMDAGAGA